MARPGDARLWTNAIAPPRPARATQNVANDSRRRDGAEAIVAPGPGNCFPQIGLSTTRRAGHCLVAIGIVRSVVRQMTKALAGDNLLPFRAARGRCCDERARRAVMGGPAERIVG